MRLRNILLLTIFLYASCSSTYAQELKTTSAVELNALLQKETNKLRIVNFWATWCKPCMAELPAFEKLAMENPNLEVYLVSLDFMSQREARVIPTLQGKYMHTKNFILGEGLKTDDINSIHPQWSGAIPFTILKFKGKEIIFEEQIDEKMLHESIKQIQK